MKVLKSLLAAALLSTVAAASGCADDEASLYVAGALYMKPPECVVTADLNSPALFAGDLDVARGTKYQAYLLVANGLAPQGDATLARAETARIAIYEAEVTVEDVNGKAIVPTYKVPVAGVAVGPTTGSTPGLSVIGLTLVVPKVVALKQAEAVKGGVTLVTKTKLRGRSNGGKEIVSKEFSFPVVLSSGTKALAKGSTACDNPVGECNKGQDPYCPP